MSGGGGALHLSLLSRGVGEVTKNGHEKIDVVLEPQDYLNFGDNPKEIYLPPIQPHFAYDSVPTFSQSHHFPRHHGDKLIPKTFTTRKGALLLFSEDLAMKHRNGGRKVRRNKHHRSVEEKTPSETDMLESDLKTVDDLAKSILFYGSQDERGSITFLGQKKRDTFDRQMRPGFSAKRYLSSWSKSWDYAVLEKVINKGYLTEKTLFYYNPLMPNHQRRLHDDMSHFPAPYKLMRNMLLSPGSLAGYTFYRVRPESSDTFFSQDIEEEGKETTSIKVINTKDGVPREVTYSSLDRTAKEDVLTDLLVKSAVHYAMIKQKEYLEDAAKRQDTIQEEDDMLGSLPKFNMKSAVDSLLDAPKASRPFLEPEFVDDKSSEHSSFRGRARKGKSKKSSRSSESGREDREYVGSLPIVSIREDNSSQVTSLPAIPGALTHAGQHKEHVREPNPPLVLPPISRQESANLSTTGEDEEEEEATPEVNILPPTPQHTSLNIPARDLALTLSEQIDEEQEGSTWPAQEQVDGQQNLNESLNRGKNKGGSLVHSSSESVGGGSVHSVPLAKPARTQWKGSTQSLKSVGSRKDKVPTGSGEESQRGSVVMGPDGQVINVGGSIGATPRDTGMIQEVNDANRHADEDETDNDEPEEWKYSRVIRRSHSKREVDLTSGDIDATLSIHSWSYNQTPALDEDYPGLKKSESSRSLPNLPFKDTELFPSILKDLTILSKATEKTEEYLDPHTLGEEKMTTVTSLESLPSSGPPKTTADLETLQENESEPQETVVTVPSGQESPHHDNNDDDARSREISQDSVNDALGFVSKVSFHKGQRSSSRESIPDIPEDRALRRGSSVGSLEKSEETAPNHSRDITPPAVPSRRGSILMSRRASRMSIVESVREEEANEGSEGDQTIPERPHTARGSVKSHGTAPSPASLHSQLSEKEVIDILTDHAAKIASEVLNNSGQGQDLRQDARTAAEIWQDWTDKHPTQSQALSRSHSVQGGDKDVLEVYIQKGKRGSAGPILPQADDDLFQKLAAAADSPDGLSPEMLQQLKEQGLTPDDVEVCEDEAGQKYVRTKSEMSRMMGGVKEGHIFGQKTGVPSIPGDRQSQADIGELDIIKYAAPPTDLDSASQASGSHKSSKRSDGGQGSGKGAGSSVKGSSVKGLSEKAVSEKGRSQPPSVTGESVTEEKEEGPEGEGPERKSLVSFRDETDEAEDEFKQAVDQVEERRSKAGDSEDQKSVVSKATEERSIKSGKSSDGGKSKVSEPSEKKRASPEKKEEFVVGKVKQSKELEQLYGPIEPAGKDNSGLTTTTDAPPPDNSKTIETKPEPPSQPPGRGLGPVAPPSKPREDKPKYVAPPTDVDTLTPIPEDGKVDYKGELQKLFGGKLPEKKKEEPKGKPKGKKPGKTKGKKGGKKTTKKEEPTPKAPPPKTESPPPAKEATPPPPQPEPEAEKKSETETDRESIAESYKTEESLDFQIIRDEFSPEPEEPSQQQHTASIHSEPSADEHTETENEDEDRRRKKEDEAARLRMISNREARAAKRAAQAEKRRQEVEKRRREREEQVRREKEEFERQQQLKQELEEERKRNEEKRRLRREQQMEEEERENAEMAERLRQEQLEQERERRRKEEYQKKLDEMKRKHLEEEEKRHQAMLEKQREEEERQREIEAMLAKKSEEERREWERQRALEEAERLRKEEEERIKREEEAKRAMEEARRLAEEMAKKQAELEARLKFNRTVQVEGQQLDHSHSITPAFVFSYYELLSWLGLEPQDFDLMKLSQY